MDVWVLPELLDQMIVVCCEITGDAGLNVFPAIDIVTVSWPVNTVFESTGFVESSLQPPRKRIATNDPNRNTEKADLIIVFSQE